MITMQMNVVAYDERHTDIQLEQKLLLEDAISDLPAVCSTYLNLLVQFLNFSIHFHFFRLLNHMQIANSERRDEMPYDQPPKTEFQRLIRSPREGQLLWDP